jgi:hypothetical protein
MFWFRNAVFSTVWASPAEVRALASFPNDEIASGNSQPAEAKPRMTFLTVGKQNLLTMNAFQQTSKH